MKNQEINTRELARQVFGFTLFEDGNVHTSQLTKKEANEMLERHQRFFPEQSWGVSYIGDEKYRKNWDK